MYTTNTHTHTHLFALFWNINYLSFTLNFDLCLFTKLSFWAGYLFWHWPLPHPFLVITIRFFSFFLSKRIASCATTGIVTHTRSCPHLLSFISSVIWARQLGCLQNLDSMVKIYYQNVYPIFFMCTRANTTLNCIHTYICAKQVVCLRTLLQLQIVMTAFILSCLYKIIFCLAVLENNLIFSSYPILIIKLSLICVNFLNLNFLFLFIFSILY